jgi:transposase
MGKGTTHVALDDSKRKIVAGILRLEAQQPEPREIPNDAHHIRRLFERLKREGPVRACYEAGVSEYDLYRQITALGVSCQRWALGRARLADRREVASQLLQIL